MKYTSSLVTVYRTSLLLFALLAFGLAGCNRCEHPVYFNVMSVAVDSKMVLDIDAGEVHETYTVTAGTQDPKKPMKLLNSYCSSDSLIHVKYTLNGMDTAFVINRKQVKGCLLGDKLSGKPGVYYEPRRPEEEPISCATCN
ncbi:MAG TPA: hypothetical protein VIN08_08550 [Ohtaekwangia sp.]|uniref:hypothetical protein n=1 Tax=Ohtaekwangia sp. TaxID=2066019 RepID=UPI002F932D0F